MAVHEKPNGVAGDCDNDGDVGKCYLGHHFSFNCKQRGTPCSRAVALLDSGSDLFPEVQMDREERQMI